MLVLVEVALSVPPSSPVRQGVRVLLVCPNIAFIEDELAAPASCTFVGLVAAHAAVINPLATGRAPKMLRLSLPVDCDHLISPSLRRIRAPPIAEVARCRILLTLLTIAYGCLLPAYSLLTNAYSAYTDCLNPSPKQGQNRSARSLVSRFPLVERMLAVENRVERAGRSCPTPLCLPAQFRVRMVIYRMLTRT